MKPYFKENRRGILRDIIPRAQEYIIFYFPLMFVLSPGELKSSPHHDINPLYTTPTRCIAHKYTALDLGHQKFASDLSLGSYIRCIVHLLAMVYNTVHIMLTFIQSVFLKYYSHPKLYFAFKITLIKVHNIINKVLERITCNQENQTHCTNKVTNPSL